MDLKPGTRWKSAVCDAQFVIIRGSKSAGEFQCGGEAVRPQADTGKPSGTVHPDHARGVLLGKRYTDEQSGFEVLVSMAGKGSLAFDGRILVEKQAKALPASD